MSWAKQVSALNAREFSWEKVAAGFTAREKVAADLGCAPENVRAKLAAGLRLGRFEARTFKVWDAHRGQFVMREGFRVIAEKKDEVGRMKDEGKGARTVRRPVPTLGDKVRTRTRGNVGEVLEVEKDRVKIRYGTREVWTSRQAFAKGDLSLVG
jgi:hypothetical protein